MHHEEEIAFSDEDFALIRRIAKSRNIPVDEAAKQLLFSRIAREEALSSGRPPAKVYELRRPKKLH